MSSDNATRSTPTAGRWRPHLALAAWLLPGLGHYLLGERRRGSILCVTILVLWASGLLIGGVTVVDRKDNFPWFLGQMLAAPAWAVDGYHQHLKRTTVHPRPPRPGGPVPRYEPSFGRVYEQGVLYTALAGLLNLLAIIDVLYRDPTRPRVEDDRPGESATAGEAQA